MMRFSAFLSILASDDREGQLVANTLVAALNEKSLMRIQIMKLEDIKLQ